MSDTWPAVWRPREDWGRPTYDEGGVLPTGVTVVHNDSSTPEPVYYGPDGDFRCPSGSDE